MTQPATSTATVQQFFAAFGRGDLDAIVATFATDASITAVRPGARRAHQVYGTYRGTAGVREFVENLGRAFDTQAFAVDHVAGERELAFASGTFTHRVKATGKLFTSPWALMCVVRDGKIVDYRFYEDSAALVAADPSAASAP